MTPSPSPLDTNTARNGSALQGVWTDRIEGRYRPVPVRQLVMAWWCYQAGHISFRQLRVYLAAHEMAERRRYTKPGGRTKPSYTIDELKALVGGRGSDAANAALAADIRGLAKLGLVSIAGHAIGFAEAIDELALEDFSGFHTMFGKVPHQNRTVPVPRRVLRALAAGYTRGMTAVILATLIRSLFWHRDKGAFRVDGRTKREWIVDVFGVSLRSVTEGRARLIELGWLVPRETSQHLLNRYGAHDQINTDWSAADANCGAGEGSDPEQCDFASPECRSEGNSASPLNRSLPQEGNHSNIRNPAPHAPRGRAGPAGVCADSVSGRKAGRGPRRPRPPGEPTIRDVRHEDLASTERLLALYGQATKAGLIGASEAGRLAFFALAERARSRGRRAGALFFWLLREGKTAYITQHDEDEAARRLREHLNGPPAPRTPRGQRWGGQGQGSSPAPEPEPSEDEKFVVACTRAASKAGLADPFHIARAGRGWTRQRWDEAQRAGEERAIERLRASHAMQDPECD